jgi:hypothetical protein
VGFKRLVKVGEEHEMMSVHASRSSRHRVTLLEHALRRLAKFSEPEWEQLPADLQSSFQKYMSRDVWTGGPDLFDLRHAALMIVRDAICRTGEFADAEQ